MKINAGDAANGRHCMNEVSKMISSNRAHWSLIGALITAATVQPSTAQVPANVRVFLLGGVDENANAPA